jgi:hypothetical protein
VAYYATFNLERVHDYNVRVIQPFWEGLLALLQDARPKTNRSFSRAVKNYIHQHLDSGFPNVRYRAAGGDAPLSDSS